MSGREEVKFEDEIAVESGSGYLRDLFNACDTKGSGFIGQDDLREICVGLGMSLTDADSLFADLDRDQNGLIDFQDFAQGFGDFINEKEKVQPGKYRRSIHRELHRRRTEDLTNQATAISNDVDSIEDVLQAMSSSPQLANCIQTVVKSLVSDVERLRQENLRLEEVYKQEKTKHEQQLRQIEDEIDSQVTKLEENIRQKVKSEAELERQALKEKMDSEMSELQTHLKLFQTFDSVMNKDREDDGRFKQMQQKLEEASVENRKLRMSLTDTQTNIALLNSEMHRLKSQYEDKCDELHSERESAYEFIHEHEHLGKQLHLLQETNKRLQDVNDSIRTAMETNNNNKSNRNTRVGAKRGSIIGDYLNQDKDPVKIIKKEIENKPLNLSQRSKSTSHLLHIAEEQDSQYESMGAKSPIRFHDELSYPIKRFMEDIDSGLSKSCDHMDLIETSPLPHEQELSTHMEDVFEDVDLGPCSVPPSPKGGWAVLPLTQMSSSANSQRGRAYGIARTASKASLHSTLAKRQHVLEQLRRNSRESTTDTLNFEPTGPPDRIYKVVFAGDAAVGKTSFILRISKGVFIPTATSTLGVDFHVKTMRVDEKNVTLQLWDTAGQERFRSVTKSYFRRADGVMLLYDCTSEHSFLNVREWMEAIDEVAEKKVPVMLCANKIDLRESSVLQGKSIVRTEDGERLAREFSAIFIETSTKTGKHVVDALIQLTREMASNEDWEVQTSGLRITQMELKKGLSCCSK
ncbi:EF-hand calcium-binding domain-containing protein 4B [Chamberlinius hualienensis]